MAVIDPLSPIPLYHQIATVIREKIESGELAPGEALEPLRRAADFWQVNLHTVRHAYSALAREGLVETLGTRGTRVRRDLPDLGHEGRDAFLRRIVQEAELEHGIGAHELVEAITDLADPETDEPLYVVECSAQQCEDHVRELRERWGLEAREWSLERGVEPPSGKIISTYFHYNDLRRLWPLRLADVHFVTIGPDPKIAGILDELPSVQRILVCERDLVTAENVAADLSTVLPAGRYEISALGAERQADALDRCDDETVAVFAPRAWAALNPDDRDHPRAVRVRYVVDDRDLEELPRVLGGATTRSPTL